MTEAYAGIDLAFDKKKRLPVVVSCREGSRLVPPPLRTAKAKPPQGSGNAGILNTSLVEAFAAASVAYIRDVESEYAVLIRRIAIDAPSSPCAPGTPRRKAEFELDRRHIGCITTPDSTRFDIIRNRARKHLEQGGPESRLPGANQLWMLVGFALFRVLRQYWECLEVFPQAIAVLLNANRIHKSQPDGIRAQPSSAAMHTGWPIAPYFLVLINRVSKRFIGPCERCPRPLPLQLPSQ